MSRRRGGRWHGDIDAHQPMADLMRLKGIGGQYSQLVQAAGVDPPQKFLTLKPRELVRLSDEQQRAKKLVGGFPKLTDVE